MANKKMKDLTKKRPIATAKAKKYKAKYLINLPIAGLQPGITINIDVDKDGIPLKKYWRRRLIDAKTDNCMELAPKEPKTKKEPKIEENP